MAVYIAEGCKVRCPDCNSVAIYKYGKNRTGKQRFLCILCGRQFTPGARRREIKDKPVCPVCAKKMYHYKIECEVIRFRCSAYPECRTFMVMQRNKEVTV